MMEWRQESQEFQMSDRTIDSSWEPLRPTCSKLKLYFIVFAQNFSSSTLKIIFLLCFFFLNNIFLLCNEWYYIKLVFYLNL